MTQKPLPYYQAARFANRQHSGTVYTTVQELIYQEVDCDLSAYRIRLNGVWHVLVIGEKPPDALHERIEAHLTNGTLVTIYPDLLHALMRRRGQVIQLGPWVEGHYHTTEE